MSASRKGLPQGARVPAEEAKALSIRVRAALPGKSAYAVALCLGIGRRTAQGLLRGSTDLPASSARMIEARLQEMGE